MQKFLDQIIQKIKKDHPFFKELQKLNVLDQRGKDFILKEEYLIGRVNIIDKNLIFLKPLDASYSQDFYLFKGSKKVFHADLVLAKKIPKSTRARLVCVLDSPPQEILVYLEKIKGKICALRLKSTQDQPLILPLKARQKALKSLPPHTVMKIGKEGKILEILGVLEDEKIDEKIILHQFNLEENFSSQVLTLAQSFGNEVYPEFYPHYKDLTHLPFCTIDPEDAKDHDDAIFFDLKKRTLYVAIADVSEYVSDQSLLDQEAKQRGFSVYFPHKSLPMLPKILSENLCSLKEGKIRLALVWELQFNADTSLKNTQFYEAMIINHCKLSYNQVDAFLEKNERDKIPKEIQKSLKGFYPLSQKLLTKRLQYGYSFLTEDITLKLNEQGSLEEIKITSHSKSHQLIEEAMLLANIQSANLLENLGAGGIYRIHEEMKEEKMIEILNFLKTLGYKRKKANKHALILSIQQWAKDRGIQKEIDSMIIKSQHQALYSQKNLGHFGLGFEQYTHFTSPIRRYSDLWVHRMLKESLHGGKRLAYLSKNLSSLCKNLSDQERNIARAEMEYKERKFAHWARKHLNESLWVRVVDPHFPILAQATQKINGAKIFLRDKISCNPLDCFEVVLEEVNLANARIYARIKNHV